MFNRLIVEELNYIQSEKYLVGRSLQSLISLRDSTVDRLQIFSIPNLQY
jgi:hypothetical protein